MEIIFSNLQWMAVNAFLAILPPVFADIFAKNRKKSIQVIFFVLWFLFIPNSIYLVTDLQYLPRQITSDISLDILLFFQYFILVTLGIVTYLYSIRPVVRKLGGKNNLAVFLFNFLISFGVMMGKIQRTESWYAITQPGRLVLDIQRNLQSPGILILIFLFGLLINFIYFSREIFRDLPYF